MHNFYCSANEVSGLYFKLLTQMLKLSEAFYSPQVDVYFILLAFSDVFHIQMNTSYLANIYLNLKALSLSFDNFGCKSLPDSPL